MKQKLSGNGDACSRGGAYIILSCLPVLLVLVIAFLIVCNADFELSDDCELLVSVCSGIPHPGLLYQNTSGRFNWSRSEYNFLLLTPFNDSPAAFYAVSAFQYLVFSSFTLLLLRDAVKRTNTVSGRLVLLGIWLTLHFGTHWTFFCLVQPERLQITLLAAFCYFLLRARETDRRRYWTASLALAAVTTYCKEPMFGAFLVLGVHILLLFRGNKKARLFSFGLFASAVLYLTLYMLIVFPNITGLYAPNGTARSATVVSKAAAMLEALRNSPLLAVCMLLALIIMARNVLCLCRRLIHKTGLSNYANKSYPPPPYMEDALLITGAAYAVGIVLTGGTIRYYFYPTLMLSFPALLLHAQEFFTRGRPLRTGALVLAALIPAYYAHYTADMVIHRVRYGHREMNEMRQL
ncbi:MAG: glycosyltransferase family 39 protein, partial [Treponema sp.]|nr:glycosyltransferase family 39 protein [Treponema sp.]